MDGGWQIWWMDGGYDGLVVDSRYGVMDGWMDSRYGGWDGNHGDDDNKDGMNVIFNIDGHKVVQDVWLICLCCLFLAECKRIKYLLKSELIVRGRFKAGHRWIYS